MSKTDGTRTAVDRATNNRVYQRPHHNLALNNLRKQNYSLCDVTIKVGNTKIQAHRAVLAATSNYFHKMFVAGFKESKKNEITIENVNEQNMQAIIDFSYTGEISITKENAVSLLKDSDFLDLDDVKEECAQFLKAYIDVKNVCEFCRLATLLPRCDSLLECSKKFIQENLGDVSLTDAYTDLDFEFLKSVLSEGTFKINSELILKSIIRWASDNIENKKAQLLMLLQCIDLSDLKVSSLVEQLYKDQLKNSVGQEIYSKFVDEVILSVFYKLKNSEKRKKNYIYVIDECASTVEIYDVDKDDWIGVESMENGEAYFASEVIANEGKLFAFSLDAPWFMYECSNFDAMVWTKTDIELPFNPANVCIIASSLNDCIYLFTFGQSSSSTISDIWRFSSEIRSGELICPLRKPCFWYDVFVLEGYLYAIGSHKPLAVATIQRYNPKTNEWILICTFNIPTRTGVQYGFGAVGINNKIYLCGGFFNNNKEIPAASVITYDLNTKEWSRAADMNTARGYHTIMVHEEKIWVFGGVDGRYSDSNYYIPSVEVYDPIKNSWTYKKPTKAIHGYFSCASVFKK